jgi:ankyrin repeat protein
MLKNSAKLQFDLNIENQIFNQNKNRDVVQNFREEIQLNYRPPINSLSEIIYNNNIEILKKILKENVEDINQRDNYGPTCSWTPLYWSVKLRRIECMKMLLEAGANINLVINDYDECCGTVLDLTTIRGDEIIEKILREYAEKDNVNFGQSFKAIRTKLRGKAPAFNFKYYGKSKKEENVNNIKYKKTNN